jgi:hypothetical protein
MWTDTFCKTLSDDPSYLFLYYLQPSGPTNPFINTALLYLGDVQITVMGINENS